MPLITSTPYSLPPLELDNIVGHWKFGEPSGTTATDEIGTNNGTYVNTPTLGITGLISGSDTAVSFDSSNTEYVNIPSHDDYNTTSLSFSFWVKPLDALNPSSTFLVGRADSTNSRGGVSIIYNTNNVRVVVKDSTNSEVYATPASYPTAMQLNVATHIIVNAAPYGGNIELFINGNLEDSEPVTLSWGFAHRPVRVAVSQDSFWQKFNGVIDDLKIRSVSYTPQEAALEYAHGTL